MLPDDNVSADGVTEYVPIAVGVVVEGPYVVPLVPSYVNVAVSRASPESNEPAVIDTVGAVTESPTVTDSDDPVTVIGAGPIVNVPAAYVTV